MHRDHDKGPRVSVMSLDIDGCPVNEREDKTLSGSL